MPNLFRQQISDISYNPSRYVECFENIAKVYKTKNILQTMGDDFAYYYAEETFQFAADIAK